MKTRPFQFVVPLRDLDDGPKTLKGEIGTDWLQAALEGTEATVAGPNGSLDVQLSKSGHQVLVRGKVEATVIVPCARTLAPITLHLRPEILLLLHRQEPAPTRGPRHPRKHDKQVHPLRERHSKDGRPHGRHKTGDRQGGFGHDAELAPMDAAQDTFAGEEIVLDSFIREFILLELPMFPVRQDLPSLPVDARASAPDSTTEPDGSDATPARTRADAESIDPRLAPLAELKDRLRQQKKQKD